MQLKGKVAVITGASRGLGRATAEAYARAGARVVIASRVAARGEETARLIRDEGGDAAYFQVDVSERGQVQHMVDEVVSSYGTVDILVNNAGITADAFIDQMTHEQWNDVIATNLTGAFNCIKAVLPTMTRNAYGRIINTSSISGAVGAKTQANYAATKAGIIGLTLSLAKELGRRGITVNAVAPGLVETDMTATIPERVKAQLLGKISVGRFGTPKEVACAYVFLASDEASYCTGTILDVNGGLLT